MAKAGGGVIIFNMSHTKFIHTYEYIISMENLLLAWKEFIVGKKSRKDVQEFERNLMSNVISLHQNLVNKVYKHSQYKAFKISTQSQEIYTKQRFGTDYYITLSTECSIHFLTGHLLPTPIRAE